MRKEKSMSEKKVKKGGGKKYKGFSDFERSAMKERADELMSEANANNDEAAVLAKIEEMSAADRAMAKRMHALIKTNAPSLSPKTWYGMPAYAKDGEVVCFFQPAE